MSKKVRGIKMFIGLESYTLYILKYNSLKRDNFNL